MQFSSFLYRLEKFHNKEVLKNHASNEYLINWKMLSAEDNI